MCKSAYHRIEKKQRINSLVIFFLFLLSALTLSEAAAMQWGENESGLEISGFLRFGATHNENPDYTPLYGDTANQSWLSIARLLGNGWIGENIGFELNAYQSYLKKNPNAALSGGRSSKDVERSGAFEWTVKDNPEEQALFSVDRLNVRLSEGRFDLNLGRQAINLATTFYFTPNDFFAPFIATTFYRVYKPGVDAARLEVRLGELSQLSFYHVLGYEPDGSEPSGWGGAISGDRASSLARLSFNMAGFEWAVIGGRVVNKNVIGASLQGELGWLGLRAEGHRADPERAERKSYDEFTFGMERSYENNMDLRLEWYYHGSGAATVSDYILAPTPGETAGNYLGRQYLAFNIGYEFSPLLSAQLLPIVNLTDGSSLLSLYLLYSLSDESEIALYFYRPFGTEPDTGGIKSEFGLYPSSIRLEARFFF